MIIRAGGLTVSLEVLQQGSMCEALQILSIVTRVAHHQSCTGLKRSGAGGQAQRRVPPRSRQLGDFCDSVRI